MTGSLGCDHDHIQVVTGNDLLKVHVKAVCKSQSRTVLDIGLDLVGVQVGLVLVRGQDHDDIGTGDGVGDRFDFQAGIFRLGGRGGPLAQTHADLHA